MCNFVKAWIGDCKNPITHNGMCDEHKDLKCCSCGSPATHECPETMGLVCGAPLCNDCEHEIAEDGTNGGCGHIHHCKKTDQKYLPWYMQDFIDEGKKAFQEGLSIESCPHKYEETIKLWRGGWQVAASGN